MITRVTLRNLAAHKVRLALTALSVTIGVCFVAGARAGRAARSSR